jgi:hypothetical protein
MAPVVMPVRYTGIQMLRRLLAFALAFVVTGGPLAGAVCEVFCAEHSGDSTDSKVPASHHHHSAEAASPPHHHHSDAPPAPTTQSVRLRPLPHACGQLQATVSESRELTRAPIATAVMTVARITPFLVRVLPTSQMDSRHGPPPPIHSTSPLRI